MKCVTCWDFGDMAELGITGKRVRKKPKYLRDDEEEPGKGHRPVRPQGEHDLVLVRYGTVGYLVNW